MFNKIFVGALVALCFVIMIVAVSSPAKSEPAAPAEQSCGLAEVTEAEYIKFYNDQFAKMGVVGVVSVYEGEAMDAWAMSFTGAPTPEDIVKLVVIYDPVNRWVVIGIFTSETCVDREVGTYDGIDYNQVLVANAAADAVKAGEEAKEGEAH